MKNLILLLGFWWAFGVSLNAQFVVCNSPTTNRLNDVFFLDENIGVAVGEKSTVLRSTDGGLNWTIVYESDPSVSFTKVRFFDQQHGIVIGKDILITEDAGQSWTSQGMIGARFYDIAVLNNTTCVVSAKFGDVNLIKSEDLGMTWDTLVIDSHFNFATLSFVNEQVGYACRGSIDGNQIRKTTDGGITWEPYSSNTGSVISVIEALVFVSEDKGFRGGWYNSSLYMTEDGAITWNQATTVTDTGGTQPFEPSILDFDIRASRPNSYYACGWYGELYKSVDGGEHWVSLNPGTDVNLYGIFFLNDNLGWIVGDDGLILKTTQGGVTANVELDYHTIGLYPNPVDAILHLDLPSREVIQQIQISTMSGQVLASFEKTEQDIDVHFLPQGVYMVQVITEKGRYGQVVVKR